MIMNKSSQTRRSFIKQLAGSAAAVSGVGLLSESLAMSKPSYGTAIRPNILFIMCDQLQADVLSCYGGPVDTPNIDRIAREGIRFTQASCPTPFCSPTRASIETSLYTHAHGIVKNMSQYQLDGITNDDLTMGKLMYQSGYDTHFYGKWHLQGRGGLVSYYPDMHREPEWVDEYQSYFQKIREEGNTDYMDLGKWLLPIEVWPPLQKAVDELPDDSAVKNWRLKEYFLKIGRLKMPLEDHFDVQFCNRAIKRINQAQLTKQPFMITCSLISPHNPNCVPSPYYEMFDPEKVELPENVKYRSKRFEKDWARLLVSSMEDVYIREFIRIYYGLVKMVDDQVGRFLDTLEKQGILDETLVIFTADHGDMAGGHGMVTKSTKAFYDEVTQVPLLMRYPKLLKSGTCDLPVNHTDFMPTILSVADIEVPSHAQGQNLMPYLTGEKNTSTARQYNFSERILRNPEGEREVLPGTKGAFMVRGKGWKYCLHQYFHDEEYLYDLKNDPGETKNLAKDPKCAPQKQHMKTQLVGWLKETDWKGKKVV